MLLFLVFYALVKNFPFILKSDQIVITFLTFIWVSESFKNEGFLLMQTFVDPFGSLGHFHDVKDKGI